MAALLTVQFSAGASAEWINPFTDVSSDAWYYSAVEYVNTSDLFAGTAADTFSPEMAMSRGMFVTVLGKFSGIDAADYTAASFSDVSTGVYYAPYVYWAADSGIVSGIGDGLFAPNSSVTREQMAVIFYRYAKTVGADTSYDSSLLEAFPDAGEISSWAEEAMAWAVTHAVLSGSAYGDSVKLLPKGTATRAQTAQIFFNAHELLAAQVEEPTVYESNIKEIETQTQTQTQTDSSTDTEESEKTTHTLSDFGVTRAALVAELSAHENDNYYLGTPYKGYDRQSPNGDTSYNGSPGMNCAGFVSYVLRKCGMDAEEVMRLMDLPTGSAYLFGSGKKYDMLSAASNYGRLVKNAGLEAYTFYSKEDLLKSGKAEKGDILFIDKGPNAAAGGDTHLTIYWGDGSSDLIWHSNSSGNHISPIKAANTDPIYVLIKLE